jgi:hypothetical protein
VSSSMDTVTIDRIVLFCLGYRVEERPSWRRSGRETGLGDSDA